MKTIKKYDQGNPITTGGAGYIPAAQPSTEQLKNAANKLGEWFLKGMGFIGDVLSTGLAYGSVSPNLLEPISDETIQQRKEAAGKVFSAVSPLNYGVALATGHGLNPYAGEEEIATWEPYQQALGRGLEMYLTPKAIKAGKAGIKRGVQEVKYKMLPYREGYKYPIGYDSKGRLYANKNYFFRQGWDLIDDAEQTGVVRVPEGDYKPAVLKKYPFLDDGFSTMQESFKFPYFGKGSVSHFKFGIEPDLIAIPDWAPNTKWVGASKWGDLQPDVTPTFASHRATPLYKGQTNKFPTSKTFRFRYNKETGQYEPVVGKVKYGSPSDFPEEGWTPFEDWNTHLKKAFSRITGRGAKPYTSPELTIFPVDEDINTGPKVKVVRNVKKPWKTDPSKVNNTTRFYIEGAEDRGYFELVKDFEPRQYSVHFKPTEADNPHAFSDVEKKVLFKAVADAVPAGSSLSTWGTLTRGGVHGLNRFGNLGFTKTGTRSVHMKSGEPIDISIFTKKAKPFYFINHLPGFQLKSLMRGNPLEQQLSENGTISVNNILNYISRRSKMEQEVVRQVLNQEQFRGQSKIDYSTFNKAVHDHLLNFQVNLDDFAPQNSNIQIFDFGDIDSEPLGPLDLQVKKQYLSNHEMPKRSEAFANSIEEARILKNVAAYEEEIAQIDKGPLSGYSNYDIFIAQLSGDYPPGMFEALQRRGQLYRQIDQLLNRYDDILSTSGGARYSQLKHLKQDYTTKLIQQTLRQASSIGYKQIFYDNTPAILRRLKKLGVDFRVRDPRIIVKVPKNYEKQEIQFKQGGKV